MLQQQYALCLCVSGESLLCVCGAGCAEPVPVLCRTPAVRLQRQRRGSRVARLASRRALCCRGLTRIILQISARWQSCVQGFIRILLQLFGRRALTRIILQLPRRGSSCRCLGEGPNEDHPAALCVTGRKETVTEIETVKETGRHTDREVEFEATRGQVSGCRCVSLCVRASCVCVCVMSVACVGACVESGSCALMYCSSRRPAQDRSCAPHTLTHTGTRTIRTHTHTRTRTLTQSATPPHTHPALDW